MKKLLRAISVVVMVWSLVGLASAEPKVQGKTVEYSAQGVVMKGYLAYDENVKSKRPGVKRQIQGSCMDSVEHKNMLKITRSSITLLILSEG